MVDQVSTRQAWAEPSSCQVWVKLAMQYGISTRKVMFKWFKPFKHALTAYHGLNGWAKGLKWFKLFKLALTVHYFLNWRFKELK